MSFCKCECRYPPRESVSLREIALCFVSSPREPSEDARELVSAHLKWKCIRRFPRHHPRRFISTRCSRHSRDSGLAIPGRDQHPLCPVIRRREHHIACSFTWKRVTTYKNVKATFRKYKFGKSGLLLNSKNLEAWKCDVSQGLENWNFRDIELRILLEILTFRIFKFLK